MAHLNFTIPSNIDDLLNSLGDSYKVKNVTIVKLLPAELKSKLFLSVL